MAAAHIDSSDLGRTPVDKVNKAAVIDWLDQLTGQEGCQPATGQRLGRKTKENIHALLSAAFVTAMEAETMTRNPAKGVAEADLNQAREAVYLSPKDLVMLASRIDPHYSLFIRLPGGTGLRYSEATALRRRDITIRDCRSAVVVSRAWKSKGNGEEIGPPKTKKANRTVTCNARLSAAIAERLQEIELDDFVFQRPDGHYVRNSRFHKEVWQPLMGSSSAKSWTASYGYTRSGTPTPRTSSTLASRFVWCSPGSGIRIHSRRCVYARLAKVSDAAADALG
jgi:integrase